MIRHRLLAAATAMTFATPAVALAQAVVVPPATVEVVPTPQPSPVWISGHWQWSEVGQRYTWVNSHYAWVPPPMASWSPGHWVFQDGGWVFISGR